MKKAIVYSTTTGNTEAMANAVKKGAEKSGAEVYFSTADSADAAEVLASDVIILGSPAMGAEEVEESMENFYSSIESGLSGKKVAIFGSYDWGRRRVAPLVARPYRGSRSGSRKRRGARRTSFPG